MAIDGMHQIGEVAEAVGLSLRTIRHYEEVGLAPPSGRSTGGFRLYTDEDVERLRFVKALKPIDLSLEQMRDLLETRDQLASAKLSKRTRQQLTEHLAMFSTLADARCEQLRQQLASVESLARQLRDESGSSNPG